MKRIFIITLLLGLTVSGCDYYPGDNVYGTDEGLKQYTMDAFNTYIVMPVLMAETAVDFDGYLSLTEEEKVNDFRFYGNIRNPEDNMYIIDEGKTLCTVKTGGKSVWDDDARWTFLSFSTHTDLIGKGDLYCSMSSARVLESDPVAPGDTSVRLFSLIDGDDAVGLELCYKEGNEYEWNVGASGTINDTDGYKAYYTTGSTGIKVFRRYNAAKEVYEYICSGEFLVTVYKDDEPIDMCKALFRPGLWTEFTIPMR